jgi:hypothetical protein
VERGLVVVDLEVLGRLWARLGGIGLPRSVARKVEMEDEREREVVNEVEIADFAEIVTFDSVEIADSGSVVAEIEDSDSEAGNVGLVGMIAGNAAVEVGWDEY